MNELEFCKFKNPNLTDKQIEIVNESVFIGTFLGVCHKRNHCTFLPLIMVYQTPMVVDEFGICDEAAISGRISYYLEKFLNEWN